MSFKRAYILFGVLIIAVGFCNVQAQNNEQENVETILKKSAEKISTINSATCNTTYHSDDERDEELLIIEAVIYFEKLLGNSELGVKTKVESEWISPETSYSEIYFNGKKEIFVYPKEKQIKIFDLPAILTGNVVGNLVQTILISDEPFDYKLENMTDVEMKEAEIVGDELCYVISLCLPDSKYFDNISQTWYISKNDYLPRKWILNSSFNGKKEIRTFTIENLEVNPDQPDSLFTLSTFPEGYEIERPEDRAKKEKPELLGTGTQAPDWTLKSGDGEEVSLTDYRGQIVILDFWGTWCPPCLEAMPELQRIHDKYEEITVIGASTNEPSNAEPVTFARNRDISYPIVLNGEKIIDDYNVRAFPTFYMIGNDGSILYHASGYGDGTGKKI